MKLVNNRRFVLTNTASKKIAPSPLYNESGNIFFYILLAVILFSALAFAVSRGMRSQSSGALSKRQIDLASSEILAQAQEIESAIDRLRRKNISEGDICFSHNQNSTAYNTSYENISTCSDDNYNIFYPDGGGLSYQKIPEDWLDSSHSGAESYGEWVFSNSNSVIDIGSGALTSTGSLDLISHINHLKKEVCESINEKLNITGIPDNSNAFAPTSPVDSGFVAVDGQINNAALSGKYSGCFKNSTVWNSYVFYHVLIERP